MHSDGICARCAFALMHLGMTADEAQSIVNVICWRLGHPPATVSWTTRARRGRYSFRKHRIAAGPRIRRGELPGLLHEIAHHVQCCREEWARRNGHVGLLPTRGRRREIHGPQFVAALKAVILLWHGDLADYPWATEYKTLRAAGTSR